MKDGVYFHMSDAKYDAADAIRSTQVKDVLVSPLKASYQVEQVTKAMSFGTAFHLYTLFGEAHFLQHYVTRPEHKHYPGSLKGHKELKAYCKKLGVKPGTSIASAIDAIRTKDKNIVIFNEVLADHERHIGTRTEISRDDYDKLRELSLLVRGHEVIGPLFRQGAPEAAIFWTDETTGQQLKCRVDWLRDDGVFVEVKTFSNPNSRDLETHLPNIMAQRQYHVSAVMYAEGIRAATKLRPNQFYDVPKGFDLDKFRKLNKLWIPTFVFAGTDIPNVRGYYMTKDDDGMSAVAWERGEFLLRKGLHHLNKLKREDPRRVWHDCEPIEKLTNTLWPYWAS